MEAAADTEGGVMFSSLCVCDAQGLEIIRGCHGLNLVGCDLVEVSPPYDTTGTVLIMTLVTLNNLFYFQYNFKHTKKMFLQAIQH